MTKFSSNPLLCFIDFKGIKYCANPKVYSNFKIKLAKMNRQKKTLVPLETIKQRPDNQDSSFITTHEEEGTMTASLPISSSIEPQSEPLTMNHESNTSQDFSFQNQSNRVPSFDKKENKKKKKKSKRNKQAQTQPKIQISNQSYKTDFKLVDEQFQDLLKQHITRWKEEDKCTEEEIQILVGILKQAKQNAFDKVLNNIEIVDSKQGEQVIPIEVSLSRNIYQHNEMNMSNLKMATERVKMEKPKRQKIQFKPQIPSDSQTLVVLQNGTNIMLDEYIQLQAKKGLKEQFERVQKEEQFVAKLQKNFTQSIATFDRINVELQKEIGVVKNQPNPKKVLIKPKTLN